MKNKTKAFLALVLTLAMLATGCAQQTGPGEAAELYKEGAYTASAQGNNAAVTVETVFSKDAIVSVTVKEHSETAGISDAPIAQIPEAIVAGQTLAVDAVTGATNTSKAILAAVEDCVRQAGGDPELLKQGGPSEETPFETEALETDVVIIGAGGAGLAAAVSAGENGARVIVIEKMPDVGGAMSLSSGLMLVAGTEQQKAAGITGDSQQVYIDDIYARSGGKGDLGLITTLCTSANGAMTWLGQNGLVWSDEVQTKPDCSFPRTHLPIKPEGATGALGDVYVKALQKSATENYGAQILLNTKGVELMQDEAGRVVGVVAENAADGIRYEISAASVVMATGGFAGNPDMARSYDKMIPDNADYYAHPGATGDGIVMGQAVGAELIGMEYIKSILSRTGATREIKNAIFVNAEGNRFFDEDGKAEDLNAAIYAQANSNCYMIYDSRTVGEVTESIQKMLDNGTLFVGETLEELAGKIGVDGTNLVKTVETYNPVAKGETADAFGRTTLGNTIEVGPFYAAERHVQVHYTMGGLKINSTAQVIGADGS
ncbi:MAG TPA: FAD-dependent oxidoreductase, partial [Terriglobales bacterium]|nr:FAD-dependent oxidoreductase [Terriglobales bacterium]